MFIHLKTIYTLFFFILWLFVLSLNSFSRESVFCGQISTIILISLSLIPILRAIYKKNILYVIFFSFIALYAFVPKYLFFDKLFLSAHNQSYTYGTTIETSLIFSLFLLVLNYFVQIPNINNQEVLRLKDNILIFWLYIILCVAIVILGKSGENIFTSGGYGKIQMQHSSINEYIIIFFLVAYIYHGKNKWRLSVLYGVAFLFCIKNLIMGGRIETIMTFLLFFTLRLQYIFSFKITMIFFVLGVWFMNIFNTIRANPLILLSSNWYNLFNPFAEISHPLPYLVTNEGDVFWGSERLLILIQESILTCTDRFVSFINFLTASIVPFSFLSPLANLSTYRTDLYTSGGGGLMPVFAFIFLSYPGVIVAGYFIAHCLNSLNDNNIPRWKYVYIVLLISTLPRWFAYYPIHLIKLCIYGVLIYFISTSIEFTIKKYIKKNV